MENAHGSTVRVSDMVQLENSAKHHENKAETLGEVL